MIDWFGDSVYSMECVVTRSLECVACLRKCYNNGIPLGTSSLIHG